MFKFKGSTLGLLLFLFVSIKLVSSRSLNKLDVEVLTPSEFLVRLSEEEKDTLVNFRVNVNKELSSSGGADFEKDKADGDVLRFADNSLNLKRGDVIYYSGLFKDGDVFSGDAGSFIFDGGYKEPDKVRGARSAEEDSTEELDSDSESTSIESRFGHHHHHEHGRRRGHKHGHEHGHGHGHGRGPPHGYGPTHFGPPPFGPPHGYPPYHHGPGPWNGQGHGSHHEFGNNGPWDGHDQDHGFYGEQFGSHHKPWNHKGDHSNENHGFNNNKPGGGGDNVNTNTGNNGLGNNVGDNKPDKGNNSGNDNNDFGSINGSNSVNNNDNGSEGNDVAIKFPTSRPVTTESVPDIDIRFSAVTSNEGAMIRENRTIGDSASDFFHVLIK